MAKSQTIMRVSALSLMGGAALLFASETGRLPITGAGGSGADPEAVPVAMSITPIVPGVLEPVRRPVAEDFVIDAFVGTQSLEMPSAAGFLDAPEIKTIAGEQDPSPWTDLLRPAAFSPAAPLLTPGAPRPRVEPPSQEALSPLGLPCGLDIIAEPLAGATLAVGVAAPCHPDTDLYIAHAGLTIGARTDAVGLLTLDVPAMASPASLTVYLPDGSEAATRVPVPDLREYDRVALSWAGALGMELHAMEAGADWNDPGHVHPGAPRDPVVVSDGIGYLTQIGTEAGMAQVYTVPRTGIAATEGVTLSVDAPITTENCTSAAEAVILRVEGAGTIDATPLSFTYPGCDAVGDTLVLQNALRDMRLAAN